MTMPTMREDALFVRNDGSVARHRVDFFSRSKKILFRDGPIAEGELKEICIQDRTYPIKSIQKLSEAFFIHLQR